MNRKSFAAGLVMLAMACQTQAARLMEYYSCDFSYGMPDDISRYDEDAQTLHYTMTQRGFDSSDSWICLRQEGTENFYAASASRFKAETAEPPGPAADWLVLPKVWIRGDEGKISWKSMIVNDQSSRPSNYEVRISTTGNRPEDFLNAPAAEITESMESWNEHSLSLSQYAGSHIWIAFVNVTDNGEILGIDDRLVEGTEGIAELTLYPGKYAIGDIDGLKIGGRLTAGAVGAVTSFNATFEVQGASYDVAFPNINLAPGESMEFIFPVKLDVKFGETFEYMVKAMVNDVQFDDIAQTTTCLAFLPERRVVIEEATGTWCQYCPMGTLALKTLEEKYPDNFIPIAIHMMADADPMALDSYATQDRFSGGAPSGWVDRLVYSTRPMVPTRINDQRTYTTLMGGFETLLLDRLAVTPLADIALTAEISSIGELNVSTTSRFPLNIDNADYRLCIVITEDHVSGKPSDGYRQSNGYSGASEIIGGYESLPRTITENLEFNHVARAIYDDYDGVAGSLPSSLKAGEEYNWNATRDLPKNILHQENLNVIAMVLDCSNGEILNAASVRPTLSSIKAVENDSSSIKVSSNNGELSIASSDSQQKIHLELIDTSGRVMQNAKGTGSISISTSSLQGLYILQVKTEEKTFSKKILL